MELRELQSLSKGDNALRNASYKEFEAAFNERINPIRYSLLKKIDIQSKHIKLVEDRNRKLGERLDLKNDAMLKKIDIQSKHIKLAEDRSRKLGERLDLKNDAIRKMVLRTKESFTHVIRALMQEQEAIRSLKQICPEIVSNNRSASDYIRIIEGLLFSLDHEAHNT
jgi:hypothetical protein